MADDITLTVRVRDLSRGELTRINQQVNRLRTNFRNAGQGANQTSNNFNRLGQDLDRLGQRFRQMSADGSMTRRAFQDLNRDATLVAQGLRQARRSGELNRAQYRQMTRDLQLLRSRMHLLGGDGNVFTRLGSHLLLFGDRFRRANSNAGLLRRTLGRIGDWGARGISRASMMLGGMSSAMGGVIGKLAKLPRGVWIFLAVLALVAPAAQALGAALTVALGGAFLALGAFALRGSVQVKGAFTQMKSTLNSVLKDAAAPLEGPLSQGLLQVGIAARQMQPQLRSAFAATGPLVQDLIGSITDFAARALPGITSALQHSKAAMGGFREAMARIGQGFGDMFKVITNGNEDALAKAWERLGTEIANVLVSIGEFTSSMLNSGSASLLMIGIFRLFTGALNLVSGALQAIDTLLFNIPKHISDAVTNIGKMGSGFTDAAKLSTMNLSEMRDRLKDVNGQIKEQQNLLKNPHLPAPIKRTAKDNLNDLLKERQDILAAISAAEGNNADQVNKEATAYKNLLLAIQALADQNRSYLDSLAGEQQAMDDADKKLKDAKKKHEDYGKALKLVNGQVDLTTQSGRDAYDMLSKIAQATKEATSKALDANVPWATVKKNWDDGYNSIVRLADGMGLTKGQAQALATQILGIPPSKDVVLKARVSDAIASLDAVMAAMQATPGAKTITVKALSADAQQILEQLGYTVARLPDGTITITAKTGSASEGIGQVQAARDALKSKQITVSAQDRASGVAATIQRWLSGILSKTVTITTVHRNVMETIFTAPSGNADALRKQAERLGGKGATGGSTSQIAKRGFAGGGSISGQLLDGPGTSTSDSIVARLSKGEFVMRAAAVRKYGLGFMQAVNSGVVGRFPGFARGGKVSKAQKAAQERAKAEKEARGEARGELTLSHFGVMAGWKNDEFVHGLGMSDSVTGLVDSLNHWRDVIMKTTHGGLEKSLLRQLDRSGKALLSQQKKLEGVNKKLDSAKTKLDDLKQAAASLRDSVTGGVMSATDITKVAKDDQNVTMQDVMSTMAENVNKSSAFSKALSDLKKRGVSGDVIQQIAQAGIEGGGLETAGAILGGSDSDIRALNDMQKKINSAAKSAGNTAADAMYGAGIKAADGLVKGLQKQQKSIENVMMKIAKSMEKALKKALGIHSPSRVMQKIGHYTAEGFAVGMEKNKTVDTAWTSMLTTKKTPGAAGSAAPSNSGQYVIPIYIGNKLIDEVWLDTGRRVVRTRGGNVQAILSRKSS